MPLVKMVDPISANEITVDVNQAGYWSDKGWVQVPNTPDGIFWGSPGANSVVARSLIEKLQSGQETAAVTMLGDSTGNNSTDWFPQWLNWLSQKFPAYSVTHLAWSDTLQGWDPSNAPGAVQYFQQEGAAGDAWAMGFAAAHTLTGPTTPNVTGDLDVRVKATLSDWTPSSAACFFSKYGGAGQRGWRFQISSTGNLTFEGSQDGTALPGLIASTVAVPFADGATGWVRVTFTAATSTLTYYTSNDGVAWTQLGTTVTLTGITALFGTNAAYEIGSRTVGSDPLASPSKIHYAEARQGIGTAGLPVMIVDMDCAIGSAANINSSGNTFLDNLGKTWTQNGGNITFGGAPGLLIFNGSTAGQPISYSNDGTRGPKQRATFPPEVGMISYGHNEGGTVTYRSAYKQLADALIAAFPDIGIVAVTQNPQTAPRTTAQIKAHAVRNRQIVSLAQTQRYGLIDAFLAFTKDTRGLTALVDPADGIHPTTPDGYGAWADAAKRFFIDVMSSDSISEPAVNGFQPFVSVRIDRFLASGTWNKPAGARAHYVTLLGPGTGGGSGRRGASGSQCGGGGGGGGGAKAASWFLSQSLTDTVAVAIGTGGAGGAAVTVDDTDGNGGSLGSQSSTFGSYLLAARGQVVGGGGTASAGGAAGTSANSQANGGAGGASGAGSSAASGASGYGNGGGGGAGITSGNVANTGAVAFPPWDASQTATNGGAINGNGADGVDRVIGEALGGYGGGGGGSSLAGPGGAGGKGGKYGAGGGGGGASRNGQASGKGGDGADGICVVVTIF